MQDISIEVRISYLIENIHLNYENTTHFTRVPYHFIQLFSESQRKHERY